MPARLARDLLHGGLPQHRARPVRHELVGQRQQRDRVRPRLQGVRGDQPRVLGAHPRLPDLPARRHLLQRAVGHPRDGQRVGSVHRHPRRQHRGRAPRERPELLSRHAQQAPCPAGPRPAGPRPAGPPPHRRAAPPGAAPSSRTPSSRTSRELPRDTQENGRRAGRRPVRGPRARRARDRRAEAPGPAVRPGARGRTRPPGPHPRAVLLRPARPLRQRRPVQRPRRPHRQPHPDRLRPRRQGLLPGRRPQGPDAAARLHQGTRHHRHLDGADLQEPARAGRGGERLRRLPRLLDHRLHPGRPPLRHQRRPGEADRRRPRQGHEGLLRRHHQPHRRHRRLRREGVRLRPKGAYPYLDEDGRPSTTVGPSAGWTRTPSHTRRWRRRASRSLLAQRPHDVPQPGRLHLGRRVRRVRRLRRPGRPVDRAARGRRGHGADLREVGPRLQDRRLPHRHRQTRRPGLLDPVGHRPRRLCQEAGPRGLLHVRRGLLRRHRRHRPLRHPGPARRHPRLPLPGRGPRLRLPGRWPTASPRSSPRTTGTPPTRPTPTSR